VQQGRGFVVLRAYRPGELVGSAPQLQQQGMQEWARGYYGKELPGSASKELELVVLPERARLPLGRRALGWVRATVSVVSLVLELIRLEVAERGRELVQELALVREPVPVPRLQVPQALAWVLT